MDGAQMPAFSELVLMQHFAKQIHRRGRHRFGSVFSTCPTSRADTEPGYVDG